MDVDSNLAQDFVSMGITVYSIYFFYLVFPVPSATFFPPFLTLF